MVEASQWDIALRLFAAMILGAIVGIEREAHGKEAGFRTYSLVSLGSALMMVVSIQMFEIYRNLTPVDPSRLAAQVVSGVGFLGAGAIIRNPAGVKGLTTAAGIWAVAGIGLACGLGQFYPAILSALMTLLILTLFSKVGWVIRGKRNDDEKHQEEK